MNFLDKATFEGLMPMLWNVWNTWNNTIFCNMDEEAHVTWERTKALDRDFCIHNFVGCPLRPRVHSIQRWKKHTEGIIKINVDVATKDHGVGIGVVERDSEGFVCGGLARYMEVGFNAEWAELDAISEGIL